MICRATNKITYKNMQHYNFSTEKKTLTLNKLAISLHVAVNPNSKNPT